MNLSVGIVGFPNVGKSTLFNALLKKQVALAANYPFATIEPNVGIAEVPDERLAVLAKIVKTEMIKPATVEFTDIAGLVKGASQGEGLGNKFLSHIRETDAICHVLRAFTDSNVIREGTVDPKEDLAAIRTELQLADLETLSKQREPKGSAEKEEKLRWQNISKFNEKLGKGTNIFSWKDDFEAPEEEANAAKDLCLLTAKKEIFVLNVDENQVKDEQSKINDWAEKLEVNSKQIVIISAKIESELAVLTDEDQKLYLQDLGLEKSGLERLAEVAYQILGLQSFLTAGELEVKAWTIRQGTTAPEAAGVIHTDFEKNFIKAKVASFKDFVELNGWSGVKEKGKLRLEGRDYVMQEGDIVEFMVGK